MTSDNADTVPGATRSSWSAALWRRRWAIGLGAAIAAGIVFRLIWLSDMEYKIDEAWTFHHVAAFWQSHDLAPIGMPSHAGVPNAGMSLWVFIAISAFVPSGDPLALARAVQLINVAAILLLALFARTMVKREEREPWLWSVALVAVNPLAVLFSRKIWPPDIMPLFTLAMLAAWWKRERWWGAFAWGLVGALLGQIQLCGFFFAAAFVAATWLHDRRGVRWCAWFVGSVIGALPLLPWLIAMHAEHAGIEGLNLANLITPFYQHWVSYALGLDLHYSLGNDFLRFLAFPAIAGMPTYLAGAFLGLVVACFVTLLWRFVAQLRAAPSQVSAVIFAPGSSTALALNAAFWGYGFFLLLTLQPVYLHYLVITFSLPALWLAWLDRAGTAPAETGAGNSRFLLASLVLAQACVTVFFLSFIHETQFIAGDYGTVYHSQAHRSDARP